jgi:quinol monooxygenase YgiN
MINGYCWQNNPFILAIMPLAISPLQEYFCTAKYKLMKRVLVQYKVKADKAEENIQLVKKVYEELKAKQPGGLRYATFAKPDGVSFVHMASAETADGTNPLSTIEAFKAFTKDIKDRCEEQPVTTELTEVGSYNFF